MRAALARLHARLKGARTFIAAAILMLPDMLQQAGSLDFSTVLPAELAARVGFILMAARILAVWIVSAKLRPRDDAGER